MIRLVFFLAFIVALASGLAWLADRPGQIIIDWEGYEAKISVFHAVVALALLAGVTLVLWSLVRHIWESPAAIGGYFNRRRQKRGLDALSTGMIAIGAGDRSAATKYAIQARKSMPNEPLTHLLRAQAAQLSGDRSTARRIYESMLASTDTEQLGLRGLFLEAEREGEVEAAKQFAERAVALNPQLSWPVDALFDLQCKSHDWAGALETLAIARKQGHVEKASAERRRAVLLTAQAQELEDKDPERALNLALDAHKLASDLVPAGAIAGRILASRGATPRATKVLQQTWQKSPHPDLATAYAYARLGDSPRDRLDRVKKLAQLNPHSLESAVAVANAAIEAKDFATARGALEPLMESRLTQRICTLMAQIEGEEHGDKGRVREWLARAVNAPRDPAWTADGIVSENWAAVSPVSGALDAFRWRVPVESMDKTADEIVARKLEELVALGAPLEVAVDAKDVTPNGGGGTGPDSGSGQGSLKTDPAATPKPEPARQPSPKAETVTDADVIEDTRTEPAAKPAPTASPSAAGPAAAIAKENQAQSNDGATAAPAESATPKDAGTPPASSTPRPSKMAAMAVTPSKSEGSEADAKSASSTTEGAAPAPTATKSASAEVRTSDRVSGQSAKSSEPKASTPTISGKREAAKQPEPKPSSEKAARSNVGEARIFVSPRAPDDPGPDGDVAADGPTRPMKPFPHGAA